MPSIAPYRTKEAAMPDTVNYAALIDEGIVLCKDGSVLAGFWFRGDDAGSSSDAEKNYISAIVNNYLHRYDSGWTTWIEAVRTSSPGYPAPKRSHFPDPISAMIDAERREMFEGMNTLFETEHAMFFQYSPPSKTSSKVTSLFYTGTGEDSASGDYLDFVLDDFKKKLSGMFEGLRDLLHMRRMGTITVGEGAARYESDELVNYLHFCVTGNNLKLRIPACPMYMDSWLGYESLYTGMRPRVGKKYICCIAISGFPDFSEPGILSLLEELPVEYRWSTRFIFIDQQGALDALGRFYRKWKQWAAGSIWSQMRRDGGGVPNLDAHAMSQEVLHATKDAKSGAVSFGYYTSVVVLMDEDRKFLERRAEYVEKAINNLGFKARIEEENTEEAWRGAMPGHSYPNVRRPFFHTLNLADLMPLSSIWPGLKTNPCSFFPENSPPLMQAITTGCAPLRINLHVGDVGHTLVFGPTGAGKSTFLCLSAIQFLRYRSKPRKDGTTSRATVTAFDKGYSMYATCSASKGEHYDIGADDSNLSLCPLGEIDSVSDLIWAEQWIGICFELQTKAKFTPTQKKRVHEALVRMSKAPKETRRMSNFLLSVQDGDVHKALSHYAVGGGLGEILDGAYDPLASAYFTVYEIDKLMSLGDENAIPVFLYLFRRFERSLQGQPALLVLDEAWVMLGNPVFRAKVREWLKELRKKNCSVLLATQSLSDAINSGILDVLIEQCPTKILLPNVEADLHGTPENPGPADLYAKFGLSEKEIEILKNAQYKKNYYYRSPLGRRLFDLGLGPLALSFVGVSDIDSVREVKEYEAQHGRDWPLHWMKDRGIDYEKYIV